MTTTGAENLTLNIAENATRYQYQMLPEDVVFIAKTCILDWVGVTLAGADEPLTKILLENEREQGGRPQATVVGFGEKLSIQQATLINGAASHALDYDDVNMQFTGHPTVTVLPAVLALAEQHHANGQQLIESFVAGYETECRVGAAMAQSHYNRGWHGTATIGTFGSAAGCGHFMGLSGQKMATALGIAATQAAGLKSQFGTMCKPFHAGKAALNGLLAANLAKKNFTSRTDMIECEQGFAETQTDSFNPEKGKGGSDDYRIRENLFKYHAACYLTHSVIEAAAHIHREHHLSPEAITRIQVTVDPNSLRVCNILSPETGLETKFSLRHTAAFALAGIDTAAMNSYSDEHAKDSHLVALRNKVSVETSTARPQTAALVSVETQSGKTYESEADVGIPRTDLQAQWNQLEAKFHSLVDPICGKSHAANIVACIATLEKLTNTADLTTMLIKK
ncbi:MAG TPA: MmgE/PrpD family protein [Gammaproteobacteria bacterium]|nr:MmgE/PrpD family protein [Gammaproteobacteria bacterium]